MSDHDIAVSVRGLSKSYTIAHNAAKHTTMGEAIVQTLKNPRRRVETETFWALRDIDFDIKKGDVVGIIGRNGAGKSTLLKVLSRITEPTTGQIDIYGRVGSLLEVGTGFHPELTGRENIYMNGAILGMTKREIARHFDDIVEFAEVEQFLDTPVKRYSSGMYVRLAFAVAAHLNPEILIVDEVLAVGDAAFQKKCLGKMKDVSQQEGRTVLFVSHNITAVQSLCNRVLWLDKGSVCDEGDTRRVIAKYVQIAMSNATNRLWERFEVAPGNEYVRLHRASINSDNNDYDDATLTTNSVLRVEFEFWTHLPRASLNLSMNVFNMEGIRVFNSFSRPQICTKGLVHGTCQIPAKLLNDGGYSIEIMIVKDGMTILHNEPDVLVFDIQDAGGDIEYYGKWQGVVRPQLTWEVSERQRDNEQLLSEDRECTTF